MLKELIENVWIMPFLCFMMAFATDWCWTKYIKRASQGKALPAAWWSLFLYGMGSTGTYIFIKNPWYIIPLMMGYFCGTYYAVKHDHKGAKHEVTS